MTDFPANLAQRFLRQPPENPPTANPHFGPFSSLPDDVTINILSFLENKDLRVQDSVSRIFRPFIDIVCQERCQDERFIPESLPAGVNYKKFLLHLFPNAIGPDFFEEYFGEVDTVPPIPRNFIEMAPRPGFKLVFIPEYITITVDANSPLQARKIKVLVTPKNIILLAQKYSKKNLSSQFGGISEDSLENVLDQNGDIGVGPSHWSYQQEDVIGLGKPYRSQPNGTKGQEEIARDQGLEIVPLGERILFHLSSYIKSGKIPPQSANIERTSTVVHSDDDTPWQSTFWWQVSGPVFRLCLGKCYDYCSVGAAVQVSAGSSQAIGH